MVQTFSMNLGLLYWLWYRATLKTMCPTHPKLKILQQYGLEFQYLCQFVFVQASHLQQVASGHPSVNQFCHLNSLLFLYPWEFVLQPARFHFFSKTFFERPG